MHKSLEAVCSSLDALSTAVLSAWNNDSTLNQQMGWNTPALTRQDLSDMAKRLSERIRTINPDKIDDKLVTELQLIPQKLQLLQANTVPQMFNGGNSVAAVPAYVITLASFQNMLEPLLSYTVAVDPKRMPVHVAKRIRSLQAQIDQLIPDAQKLASQITLIQDATEAAESLPTDMQALEAAQKKVEALATQSDKLYTAIEQRKTEASEKTEQINKRWEEAERLVSQCDEAYRITTTAGLAAAFDRRAKHLNWSMVAWVVGLLAALAAGAYLGEGRVALLSRELASSTPNLGAIGLQAILSLLSIGAPLWFAWVATKQIGQRFRLAEDYGFKASVAKAYEGYRKEAARIDAAFEARLFSSALSRLEEPPLRFVDNVSHGSPWQEFFSSPHFQKALETIPELKELFIELAKRGINNIKPGSKIAATIAVQQESASVTKATAE